MVRTLKGPTAVEQDSDAAPTSGISIGRLAVGDTRTLFLDGELDIATAPVLLDAAYELVHGARVLALDLSALTFIDSSGLHGLLRVQDVCRDTGCRLLVAHAPPQVLCLMEVTGVSPATEDGSALDVGAVAV
jgi:anti-anti-sigma factor